MYKNLVEVCMKNRKRILSLILVLLTIVSCSSKEADVAEPEIKNASDLIASIDNHEKTQESQQAKESQPEQEGEETESSEEVIVTSDDTENKDEENQENETDKVETITLKAVGDIMAHQIQNQYAQSKGGGSYDFTDSFTYVKDFISDADISIGNYETTTNPNLDYAGYPRFNTPPAYIEAIKDAGFDVLATANNHSLDTEVEGLLTTIDHIEENGLDHVGTKRDESERILIKDVNGIKLAFLSYTYGANGRENLVQVREEVEELNYLNDEQIETDIRTAKARGADFVIVYPHWGIEYQSSPDQRQIELGRNMIEWGADLVIGNHPHVVQPYEYVETSDGRKGFIAYACGNFISFQNLENNGDIRVEQAVAYEIELSKNFTTGTKKNR